VVGKKIDNYTYLHEFTHPFPMNPRVYFMSRLSS
jgi:hypothetical protein